MSNPEIPNRNVSIYTDLQDLAGPVPDKVYFFKLLKRHYRFWIIGSLLVLLVAITVSMFVRNVYTSNIHAIFDQTDSAGTGVSISSQVAYTTVARLYRARFKSQEFLYEVVENMGGKDVLLPPNKMDFLQDVVSNLKLWVKKNVLRRSIDTSAQDNPNSQVARTLIKMLDVYPEPESGILTLTAYTHSPEISSELATTAMELFIRRELEDQIKNLELKLEFFKGDTGAPPQEGEDKTKPEKAASATDESPSQLSLLRISEKEAEISEKIRLANDELIRTRSERTSTINSLNTEIARLLTSLQPNHPLLISKRKDLESKIAVLNAAADNAQKELEQWKQALWAVRASKMGPKGGAGAASLANTGYQGAFYVALNDHIKDLDLEIKNLQRQMSDPNLRTRLRVLFPASFDESPFANKKRDLFIAICGLGMFFVFGFSLVKEARCPLARDDWRIQRASGQPIITQISKVHLEGSSQISADMTDKLRERLFRMMPADTTARNFLSYRRWELAIEKHCKGSVILIIASGTADEIGEVIFNFFNIFTTDTGKRCLVVDLDHKDPVVRSKLPTERLFVDVLLKQVPPQAAVCKGKDLGLGFDYIPPPLEMVGEKTRIFRKHIIKEFLTEIGKDYDVIFVRGLPEYHFIENTCLMDAADDCILCVDASRTQFAELKRTVMHMDSEKLRGLVVIGS